MTNILPFPRKKGINESGVFPRNMYPGRDSGLISADSTSSASNLTSGCTPNAEEEMSYRWMMAVLPLKIPANEKSVLTILAFHANEDGNCWPSVGLLAKECCISRGEIQKCLSWLEKHNFIERRFRKGHSTMYCVNDPASISGILLPPLDAQNVLLNGGKESCSPRTCKKHHFGCTVFTSPVWVGDKKPGKRA